MKSNKFGKLFGFMLIAILLPALLLIASSCTPGDAQTLEGILQNVDKIKGDITVETKDGQTIKLNINTNTSVETDNGTASSIETLEPGSFVEVKKGKDKEGIAQSIKVHLAKVEGKIIGVTSSSVTVESDKSAGHVTVNISDSTIIKLENDANGTVNDLTIGAEVDIKYDPESRDALKIHVDTEEEAEIEGEISEISGNNVTIQTEKGRKLTLVIDVNTRFEDSNLADLKVGAEVKAKFDPFNLVLFKIEVEEQNESKDEDRDEEEDNRNHENDKESESKVADRIPHSIEGRDNCLACHGENGIEPYPDNHVGRTNDTCLTCHQLSS